jgi:xylanolytic transcriptional activator XlnR
MLKRQYSTPCQLTLASFRLTADAQGDVIETHRRSSHPRLGTISDTAAITMIESLLATCAQSIHDLSTLYDVDKYQDGSVPASYFGYPAMTPSTNYSDQDPFVTSPTAPYNTRPRKPRRAQVLLVTSYARFIVNVLHVLLHGKWDAVSMLSPDTPPPSPTQTGGPPSLGISNWITSVEFMKCASHAILASEAVETILSADPELTFMPYLLGIYLLHGSFILLLFADRMPQVGPNESVERACETIIRAHEVCVVTLSTEFQKRFRKVLRGTLYEVRKLNAEGAEGEGGALLASRDRDGAAAETEEGRARRSALSLYRWTRGSRGLAL